MATEAKVAAALDRLAGGLPSLGVALSGGGDSVALLHIVANWAGPRRVMAATVDHGLRPESRAEAEAAGQAAQALGIGHETLTWHDHAAGGNLMAQARDARRALLGAWAARHDLAAVALGHNRDDVAETLLMRLSRGAGVDGLAAMAETHRAGGTLWLRPMLAAGRDELRDWLRTRGVAWTDDPSNADPGYDRARIRAAMRALHLPVLALADSAAHLAQARDALAQIAAQTCRDAQSAHGALSLDLAAFTDSPAEIRRRILIAALRFVTGADYPPRRSQTDHALVALAAGQRVTLDGMILTPSDTRLQVIREPAAAIRAAPARQDGPWDNRWHISGLAAGETVGATGYDALPDLDWRGAGLSRDEAAASPAIRGDGALVAAPLIAHHPRIAAKPLRKAADFRDMFFAH